MNLDLKNKSGRLSHINTSWTDILKASFRDEDRDDRESNLAAQQHVLERYGPCTFRYILGATKDAGVAEELNQEFAFRFVRGDFKNVSPDKGRFRDYLKAVLRNIVNDYFRSRQKDPVLPMQISGAVPAVDPFEELEDQFSDSWRQELLAATWSQLQEYQLAKENHYYSVLRFRAEHPELDSKQMASQLSEQFQREVSADWVRQNLKRARSKFCALLISEVTRTLPPDSTEEEIQSELAELGLLKYTTARSVTK